MFVACVCCVLSGRGLCDGLITRLEASCWVCVFVFLIICDLETSTMKWLTPNLDCRTRGKEMGNINICYNKETNSMGQSPF